jgi:hypothetical protein
MVFRADDTEPTRRCVRRAETDDVFSRQAEGQVLSRAGFWPTGRFLRPVDLPA